MGRESTPASLQGQLPPVANGYIHHQLCGGGGGDGGSSSGVEVAARVCACPLRPDARVTTIRILSDGAVVRMRSVCACVCVGGVSSTNFYRCWNTDCHLRPTLYP